MSASTTTTKRGRDILPGDRVQLEDGTFAKIAQIVRAPIRMVDEDGEPVRGLRWAYFANGGHTTIAADDEVTVRA